MFVQAIISRNIFVQSKSILKQSRAASKSSQVLFFGCVVQFSTVFCSILNGFVKSFKINSIQIQVASEIFLMHVFAQISMVECVAMVQLTFSVLVCSLHNRDCLPSRRT